MRLLINRNCGAGPYYEVARSDDIEELKARGAEYDEQMIRWYICRDDDDEPVEFSAIHKSIVDTIRKANGLE